MLLSFQFASAIHVTKAKVKTLFDWLTTLQSLTRKFLSDVILYNQKKKTNFTMLAYVATFQIVDWYANWNGKTKHKIWFEFLPCHSTVPCMISQFSSRGYFHRRSKNRLIFIEVFYVLKRNQVGNVRDPLWTFLFSSF